MKVAAPKGIDEAALVGADVGAGELTGKARAVAERAVALHQRAERLQAELAAEKVAFARTLDRTRAVAFEAQAREAAARNKLTGALIEALASGCETLTRTRAALAEAYFPTPKPPWRGRARLFRLLETAGYLRRKLPPMFDAAFYAAQNSDELAAARMGPAAHYVAIGSARGLAPHPLFDPRRYVAQGPRLAAGEDVVSHYLREGWRLGLTPHPLFSPTWYASQAGSGETPPLIHYLEHGWRAGISPHPMFDAAWYLETNPDVAASGGEPLSHFVAHGAAEGRAPNPWFDLDFYKAARGAALSGGDNPLVDYLEGGAWVVAEPAPGFAAAAYVAAHPELVAERLTPLEHWILRNRPRDR